VDILPTILDLLNISSVHSSMGSSLLDKSKEGFAVTSFYPSFLFFSNKNLYVDDFDQKQQFFEDFKNTKPQANIFETNKEKSLKLQRKLKSYIQAVTNAVNHDLIYKTN
jgi:phosphoglycerol transferase MdoB-like AlkP superfamily enzyme